MKAQKAVAAEKPAEAALNVPTGALQEFVGKNFRIVPGGLIYYSAHKRDWLDSELRRD